jgi:hypothetical protein
MLLHHIATRNLPPILAHTGAAGGERAFVPHKLSRLDDFVLVGHKVVRAQYYDDRAVV